MPQDRFLADLDDIAQTPTITLIHCAFSSRLELTPHGRLPLKNETLLSCDS